MIATRLVGRDNEFTSLGEAVARARDGARTTVVIDGDAGIGKSRLVTEALTAFADGKDVVSFGHGLELAGGELPYGTIRDTLRTLVRDAGADVVRNAAGPYADQLAALCPALGTTPAQLDRLQLLPAYVTALENLAADRLVWLVIEDLHWVDAPSRDLLTYLVRVARPCRLLTLLTARTHDPALTTDVANLIDGLAALDSVDHVTLTPLAAGHTRTLVTDLTAGSATQDQVAQVISLAQGNPLLAEQLVAAGLDPSGERVTSPMASRIRALDSATRRLVQVASLSEDHLTHRNLSRVYGQDDFDEAVDAALEAALLRFDPAESTYRFHHALLRQAAEDSLTPSERRTYHRCWAELLTPSPGHSAADPRTVFAAAHHWAAAGVDDQAFDAALAASRLATDLAAPAQAASLLSRVLALWEHVPDATARAGRPRDDVLADALWSLYFAGDLRPRLQLYDAELARPEHDPIRLISLRLNRDATAQELGTMTDPDVYREALARVDDLLALPATSLMVMTLGELGWSVRFSDPDLSYRLHEHALAEARKHGHFVQLRQATLNVLQQQANRGRTDEALALCGESQADADSVAGRYRTAVNIGFVMTQDGRFADAIAVLDRALSRLPELENAPNFTAWGKALLCDALEAAGEWDRAQNLLDELATVEHHSRERAFEFAISAGQLACGRGELDTAERWAAHARSAYPPDANPLVEEHQIMGWDLDYSIAAARGVPNSVRPAALAMLQHPGLETYADTWRLLLTAARVEADLARRIRSPAADVAADALYSLRDLSDLSDLADRLPRTNPYNHARYLHVSADLARGEGADTAHDWEEAAAAWRRIGHPHYLAWACLRLASVHATAGDRDRALEPLDESLKIARRLEAAPLREAAIGLARRANLRLQATPASQPDATDGVLARLTERELEVLRHLARGATNNELASALFISPKTASVHVSRILTKLGVPNRGQAASFAYEHGLLDARD